MRHFVTFETGQIVYVPAKDDQITCIFSHLQCPPVATNLPNKNIPEACIVTHAERATLLSCLRRCFVSVYLHGQIVLGTALLVVGLLDWESHNRLRFAAFLVSASIASALKVRLPGITGTVSVSFLFSLIGIVDLSISESLAVGTFSALVQCLWRTEHRPKLIQVSYNLASRAIAIYVSWLVYGYANEHTFELVSLGLLSLVYYFFNTLPIAGIIALTEAKSLRKTWGEYGWMLPYYIVGTSLAWLIGRVPPSIQGEIPIICLPIVYLVHRSYHTYVAQIEHDKKHVEELNSLHLRTIEALALAIDAKDHTTHDHLQRVQLYAIEIGKDLELSEQELEALRAAAVLHDIGKLAVPEHIISKPGKLTRAEFEKMKIHPVVGAEILERVAFPYPVVPIVRAHHEKWDGSGYPYGLVGEQIPVGARILAAVDCLDALASDRQYRRALPLDEAMAKVAAEAGTAFDPKVVQALQARYRELERQVQAICRNPMPPLSTDIKITRGGAPAAGFETEAPIAGNAASAYAPKRIGGGPHSDPEFSLGIPSNQADGLSVQEALAVIALRLKQTVPFDAIAFFACGDGALRPEFVIGDDHRALVSLSVPIGQGLTGWVAETGKPILNGNPTVEPGYTGGLRSAVALPLVHRLQIVGVLAVYRSPQDAFTADELAYLSPLSRTVGSLLVESAYEHAASEKSPFRQRWDHEEESDKPRSAPVYSISSRR